MLTPKAHSIRIEIDARIAKGEMPGRAISRKMINELIDNCQPTAQEFDDMIKDCIITGVMLYRLIMEAPQRWREAK